MMFTGMRRSAAGERRSTRDIVVNGPERPLRPRPVSNRFRIPALGLVVGSRVRPLIVDDLGASDLNAFLAGGADVWDRLDPWPTLTMTRGCRSSRWS